MLVAVRQPLPTFIACRRTGLARTVQRDAIVAIRSGAAVDDRLPDAVRLRQPWHQDFAAGRHVLIGVIVARDMLVGAPGNPRQPDTAAEAIGPIAAAGRVIQHQARRHVTALTDRNRKADGVDAGKRIGIESVAHSFDRATARRRREKGQFRHFLHDDLGRSALYETTANMDTSPSPDPMKRK